jgi:hypothetical protein
MTSRRASTFFLVAALVVVSLGCVDATHEDAVNALGPEDPNVPRGPDHRPGQPCLTCHGASGPSSHQFSIGGTVYAVRGQPAPAAGANVQITDINGSVANIQTRQSGNFYITLDEWVPVYPLKAQVQLGGSPEQMETHIGRDGSCADCHLEPAGATSNGHIYTMIASGGP